MPPPGLKGTTRRTGLVGYRAVCASAKLTAPTSASTTAPIRKPRRSELGLDSCKACRTPKDGSNPCRGRTTIRIADTLLCRPDLERSVKPTRHRGAVVICLPPRLPEDLHAAHSIDHGTNCPPLHPCEHGLDTIAAAQSAVPVPISPDNVRWVRAPMGRRRRRLVSWGRRHPGLYVFRVRLARAPAFHRTPIPMNEAPPYLRERLRRLR